MTEKKNASGLPAAFSISIAQGVINMEAEGAGKRRGAAIKPYVV